MGICDSTGFEVDARKPYLPFASRSLPQISMIAFFLYNTLWNPKIVQVKLQQNLHTHYTYLSHLHNLFSKSLPMPTRYIAPQMNLNLHSLD